MVSKGELGVSYLVAVGLVLFGVFSAGMLQPFGIGGTMGSRSFLGLTMGVMIAGSFVATGVGLAQSTLDDERVWRVAGWSTLGLGLPTLIAVGAVVLVPSMLQGIGWRSVIIVNIAGGGVVGVLVGSLLELRAEHERTRTLNQRNTVFLRLFRHDIRTSLNLIRGHLDSVTSDGPTPLQSAEVIRDHIAHIERLSDAASRLDDLESMVETEPINLGGLVRERLGEIRQSTDEVTVETAIDDAYVAGNELLSSVVDNLLRNAVEHGTADTPSESDGDADTRVRVTVQETGYGAVRFRVADDGPGFDDTELAVHTGTEATETALQHSDGVGLWLVRWIVDAYGGEFSIGNADDGGAVVTVTLPRTEEPPSTMPDTGAPASTGEDAEAVRSR